MAQRPLLLHSRALAGTPILAAVQREQAELQVVERLSAIGLIVSEVQEGHVIVILLDDTLASGRLPPDAASWGSLRVVSLLAEGSAPPASLGIPDDQVTAFLSPSSPPAAIGRAIRTALREASYLAECDRLSTELARHASELKELYRIGIALSAERDHMRLLALILRTIREFTCADGGSVLLVEHDEKKGKVLRFKLFQNDSLATSISKVAQFSLPIDLTTIAGYVASTGEPVNLPDVYQIPKDSPFKFNPAFDDRMGYRTRSMLVLPMKNHLNKTIGVIQLVNKKRSLDQTLEPTTVAEEVVHFDERSMELATSLASQAAVCLENDMLYEGLERKVRERTKALEHAMSELVEKEKLASVGQLTAGVAHEINNPLAFGRNNLHLARERIGTAARRLAIEAWLSRADDPEVDIKKRAEEGTAVLERLGEDATFKNDVRDVKNDAADMPPPELVGLLKEFFTYVTKRKKEEDGDVEGVLTRIDGILGQGIMGLDRVKEIVMGLRNFSRLDEAVFQDADVDLGIKNTLTILAYAAREKKVRVVPNLGLSKTYACFPAKLNQVVLNLVNNAIDACEMGGEVTVTSEEKDGHFHIHVRDNGHGIKEEHIKKLFVPFFTTKPVGKGTGLGLSISYRIVQEHKGTILVQRNDTGGTTFTVRIPVEQPRPGGMGG